MTITKKQGVLSAYLLNIKTSHSSLTVPHLCNKCAFKSCGRLPAAIQDTSSCLYYNSAISPCAISSAAKLSGLTAVINGGKKAIYTTALTAMLQANLTQFGHAQSFTSEVTSSSVSNEIISSGTQNVNDGGITTSNTIGNSGTQNINFGGTANHTSVNSGGLQHVSGGGTANSTAVNEDAMQFVFNGGTANNTALNSGWQHVYGGGSANSTTINNSGVQFVYNGANAGDTTVNSGGAQYVNSNGTANGTTVNGEGYQHIANSGTANGTIVNKDGTQYITNGGTANNATLNSGWQYISAGGTANNTSVNARGTQTVSGTANGTVINESGAQYISNGGTANGTAVNSKGTQYIFGGGAASGTSVNSGGSQIIYPDGIADGTVVNEGGEQHVSRNATANNAALNSGAQYVSSTANANSTTVNNSGKQHVFNGGTASSTSINSGGSQIIYNNGTANRTTVNEGGVQFISNGGSANNTSVNPGGSQTISGAASNTTINNSGAQHVYGSATGTTLNGGTQTVYNGGTADTVTVNEGGVQFISNGGSANNTSVNPGGSQTVSGAASNTTINNSGAQHVYGSVTDTTLNGGSQTVYNGGTADGATVNEGGTQYVYEGGSANGTVVSGGGFMHVSSGSISGTFVQSNGALHINSAKINDINVDFGAVLDGNVLHNFGLLNLSGTWINPGTSINGAVNLDGGTIDIRNSASSAVFSFDSLNANSGIIEMNVYTDLSGGSDLVKINGAYSGNTYLKLNGLSAEAAHTQGNGILLVEFGPEASIAGIFELLGDKWDHGGYEYLLYQGAADNLSNYYLRSTKIYSNTFKTMANVPVMAKYMAKTGMNNLQKRLGSLRSMNNQETLHGAWGRTYVKKLTAEDMIETDLTLYGLEAGYDYLFFSRSDNKLYAGVMAGYQHLGDIKTKQDNGRYSKGDGNAPSLGVYAALFMPNGWFIDAALRNYFTGIEITNYAADGDALSYKPKRNVLAFSVEGGKEFKRELGGKSYLRFEPKAELLYMNAEGKDISVSNGSILSYKNASYLKGKAALLLSYTKIRANGLLIEPVLELAYGYDFAGKNDIEYGGAVYKSDLTGGAFEAALGLNMQFSKNIYAYLQGSYEKGSKIESYGGNFGARFAFGGKKARQSAPKNIHKNAAQKNSVKAKVLQNPAIIRKKPAAK